MPRKVNFMVSLRSCRIQLSSAPCNYKTKMNFQKTALLILFSQNALYLVHAMFGGRGFVLIAIGDFSYISSLTGRYKGDQKV